MSDAVKIEDSILFIVGSEIIKAAISFRYPSKNCTSQKGDLISKTSLSMKRQLFQPFCRQDFKIQIEYEKAIV